MTAILAIDPGFSLGWSYWQDIENYPYPSEFGLITQNQIALKNFTWEQRLFHHVINVELSLKKINSCTQVLIERPDFVGISRGSDIGKLQTLCGWVAGSLSQCFDSVEFVPVSKWKGQLPKKVVEQRILDYLSKNCDPDLQVSDVPWKKDTWDAVGIGLWYGGYINQ